MTTTTALGATPHMFSIELNPSLSPEENGQFQWQFACTMVEWWQKLAPLYGHDPERALVFWAIWSVTLDPVSNAPQPPNLGSSSNLSEVAFHAEKGVRLNQLARTVCLNRTTVRRKLDVLIEQGLVVCLEDSRYLIAPRLVETHPEVAAALAHQWSGLEGLLNRLLTYRALVMKDVMPSPAVGA